MNLCKIVTCRRVEDPDPLPCWQNTLIPLLLRIPFPLLLPFHQYFTTCFVRGTLAELFCGCERIQFRTISLADLKIILLQFLLALQKISLREISTWVTLHFSCTDQSHSMLVQMKGTFVTFIGHRNPDREAILKQFRWRKSSPRALLHDQSWVLPIQKNRSSLPEIVVWIDLHDSFGSTILFSYRFVYINKTHVEEPLHTTERSVNMPFVRHQ